MEIRKSTTDDVPAILEIFRAAKAYMAAHGNPTQWGGGYPGASRAAAGHCPGRQLCPDRRRRHRRHVFVYHRRRTHLSGAAERTVARGPALRHHPPPGLKRHGPRGVRACFDFCTGLSDYVRVDTHADNRAMQAAIEDYGFRKCGNIYASSGTLRTAYDYVREG